MEAKLKKIVMWALTYKCNMKCQYCYLKNFSFPYEDLSKDACISIATKICLDPNWKPDAVWLTGGEPTLKPFLPDLVRLFHRSGIRVVIDTNGMCSNSSMISLLESEPEGIIISLDSHLEDTMSDRGDNAQIKERIRFVADHKHSHTILGTAIVITQDSLAGLYEYAKEMRRIGVEYISLNPYHSSDITDKKCNIDTISFIEAINKIKNERIIKLPSDDYLSLVVDLYSHKSRVELQCPSFNDYYFISPWGYIYPCSNEMWQKEKTPFVFNSEDATSIHNYMRLIAKENGFERKNNRSSCFGARCIGCWKLYYDTIFTK